MMKLKSAILALTLVSYSLPTISMLPAPTLDSAKEESSGWSWWLPYGKQADMAAKNIEKVGEGINKVGEGIGEVGKGFHKVADSMNTTSKEFKSAVDNASGTIDKGINTLSTNVREATADFVKATDKLSSEMDTFQKAGVKVAPETIIELNKTGVSLMKTYLVAGLGGAIALTGVILGFKTLMSQKAENTQDTRPLYKRILTNRYLISALLVASGVSIILKSDRIVTAVS